MNKKFISVITTSHNSAKYIESTIQSVTQQNYKNVQYIIIDACSSDGTSNILNTYKESIDTLVIEPDDGMYHGIQKGAAYVEGEIMAWLNSDDIYLPWTLSVVHDIFEKYPEIDWIIGQPSYLNEKGQCIKVSANAGSAYPEKYIKNGWFRPRYAGYLQQESMFWRKSLWDKVGGLNLDYTLAADFDLWKRFALHAKLYSVATPLSCFRLRPGEQQSSAQSDKYEEEVSMACAANAPPNALWRILSACGYSVRLLLRLFIWKKTSIIVYSSVKSDWVIKRMYRPLSRYSFAEAFMESKSASD